MNYSMPDTLSLEVPAIPSLTGASFARIRCLSIVQKSFDSGYIVKAAILIRGSWGRSKCWSAGSRNEHLLYIEFRVVYEGSAHSCAAETLVCGIIPAEEERRNFSSYKGAILITVILRLNRL